MPKWPCRTACKYSLRSFPAAVLWSRSSRRKRMLAVSSLFFPSAHLCCLSMALPLLSITLYQKSIPCLHKTHTDTQILIAVRSNFTFLNCIQLLLIRLTYPNPLLPQQFYNSQNPARGCLGSNSDMLLRQASSSSRNSVCPSQRYL